MIPTKDAALYMQCVHDWHMEVFPGYVHLSLETCAREVNGIGSDDTPEWLRGVLGAVLPYARVAAFLHDLEGCFMNDGTREGFEAWNARFRRNIKRDIRQNIPSWRFATRWRLYRTADLCYLAVMSDVGWKAWRRAYERLQSQSEPGKEVLECSTT